ncbi:hypothetical protein GCM10025864_43290 [Luteimicrobium album]|uniref:Ribose-5-phosphate isomerase n=1 Tax=Luteimicrobium album TaxID=1054550 RepID=A0ABQ6I7Q8_9MICO|nr:hypothetical protein GCM10025864_43290 [Luteimicrobium album]
MRVHIASDHAGYELKSYLVAHLQASGHDVVDHGAHAYDREDDYPSFCIEAGEAVVADPGSLGVVIGGRATASRSPRTRSRACGPRWPGTPRRPSWAASTTTRT